MVRLCITGGIGSGKSGVSELLRVRDVPVYDCDREAKRLMTADGAIRTALEQLVAQPEPLYDDHGTLNRRLLAAYMFGHPDRVQAVNAIVHPAVRADFRRWTAEREAEGYAIVAMESAIVYEAGMEHDVDKVVLVYTPREERIARTMERDHATRESVLARMASQMSDEEKLARAHYIIRNAEADAVTPQVEDLMKTLGGIDRKTTLTITNK